MPTAAAIIIGNEILTGKFADENGPYLIRRLRALGCELQRLVVIADEVEEIAREVSRCAKVYDHVFTTGGVGPTHDDVTLEAIARAFDEQTEVREELVALIRRFGLPENSATLRMATLPKSAVLVQEEALSYPIVTVHNVVVFPGVPKLFRAKFEVVAHRFRGPEMHTARIYTDEWESRIAERLATVQDRYQAVEIGSYPRFGEGNYKVIVTLESRDRGALDSAAADLSEVLNVVLPVHASKEEPAG